MSVVTADIESLDQEGRGVTHVDGKVVFARGALAGERVEMEIVRRKPSFDVAKTTSVLTESSSRTTPRCDSFGMCGGCSMQHLAPRAQVAAKQRVLEDSFAHIGKVSPQSMLAPIHGPAWGYRYRARFSSRYVRKRGQTLVGFRERGNSFVADMQTCDVVPARISRLLVPLRALIDGFTIRERLPQIELAIGEGRDALAFRNLDAFTAEDEERLRDFSERYGVHVYLQPGGPDTVHLFHPVGDELLSYTLPDFGLEYRFRLPDFTQVNHQINRVLVRRAIALLDPHPGERIGDMFCGIGNFSLPVARRGALVTGVEGSRGLVDRAQGNAQLNELEERCRFHVDDLFKIDSEGWARLGPFDKLLVDPPRDGAAELINLLGRDGPRRVVYVSCNPATLARDAGTMVHENGYTLSAAGVVNMFPHTSHVESIAVFDK